LPDILQRSGCSYQRFRQHFDDKEACFAEAYGIAAVRLCEEILDAGRSGEDWRQGFRAGLAHFLGFVAEEPLHARALLIEDRVAGDRAADKHHEVIDRLAAAIDGARREIGPRRGPPPMSARLIIGAIEAAAAELIMKGRAGDASRKLPELTHFGVLLYFGHDAAEDELTPE
jgi:AcrR family transcriptional regulator